MIEAPESLHKSHLASVSDCYFNPRHALGVPVPIAALINILEPPKSLPNVSFERDD